MNKLSIDKLLEQYAKLTNRFVVHLELNTASLIPDDEIIIFDDHITSTNNWFTFTEHEGKDTEYGSCEPRAVYTFDTEDEAYSLFNEIPYKSQFIRAYIYSPENGLESYSY